MKIYSKTSSKSNKRKSHKKTKNDKKTKKHKKTVKQGGSIVGLGAEGCIIDTIQCGKYSNELGYIAKVVKKGFHNDKEFVSIQEILMKIDPEEIRFAHYHLQVNDSKCDIKDNVDVKQCELQMKSEIDKNRFYMTKKLITVDPSKLDKRQYRHLRTSLEILRENKIIHGDLPGNVMLNSLTNLPVIIDWDNSIMVNESNTKYQDLDMKAFLNKSNFAVQKC